MLMKLFSIIVIVVAPTPAFAYIGPGLGIGAITAIIGILGGLALALVAIVFYPIKRFLRKIRQRENKSAQPNRKQNQHR